MMSQRSGYVIVGENYSYICVQSQLKKKKVLGTPSDKKSQWRSCVCFWFWCYVLKYILSIEKSYFPLFHQELFQHSLTGFVCFCLLGYFILFFVRRCLMFTRIFVFFFYYFSCDIVISFLPFFARTSLTLELSLDSQQEFFSFMEDTGKTVSSIAFSWHLIPSINRHEYIWIKWDR